MESSNANSIPRPLNYFLALGTMGLGMLGLWIARSILLGTIIAVPTVERFIAETIVNESGPLSAALHSLGKPTLGMDSLLAVIPTCFVLFGIFLAVIVAVYSIQAICCGLNAVRILNGEGEAVKGVVINFPKLPGRLPKTPAAPAGSQGPEGKPQ